MEEFETYADYQWYVKEEWEDGYINELVEAGLIIESEMINNTVTSRLLTEQEFNERFNKISTEV